MLSAAFTAANKAILDTAWDHPECKGMGTTCTVLAFRDRKARGSRISATAAHLLLRKGKLMQLSEDQTLVAKLVSEGTLTQEQGKSGHIRQCHVCRRSAPATG